MRITLSLIVVILLLACNPKDKPDVSSIKVDISIERFEKDFFQIDTNHSQLGLETLNEKYPVFLPVYLNDILGVNLGPSASPKALPAIDVNGRTVINSLIRDYSGVAKDLDKKYANLGWLEAELESGFKYVNFYYPKYEVPKLITFIGSFDVPGVVLTSKYIGIGLQQFAGRDYVAYDDPMIAGMYPKYISRRFDKEYISSSCMRAVVQDIYSNKPQASKLIEIMIEQGKEWYLLDKFLPDAPDSVKTGYTANQLRWANENEGNIWGSILNFTPDLFTMDPERIRNYIGDAPNTMGMPEASPGNIGQWVGWQIVKKYAEKNSKLSVPEVMATAADKIFQGAKYKPK